MVFDNILDHYNVHVCNKITQRYYIFEYFTTMYALYLDDNNTITQA